MRHLWLRGPQNVSFHGVTLLPSHAWLAAGVLDWRGKGLGKCFHIFVYVIAAWGRVRPRPSWKELYIVSAFIMFVVLYHCRYPSAIILNRNHTPFMMFKPSCPYGASLICVRLNKKSWYYVIFIYYTQQVELLRPVPPSFITLSKGCKGGIRNGRQWQLTPSPCQVAGLKSW